MNKRIYYLKTYRERSGIALQDIAEIIGIDISSLSKIENGKRKPDIDTVLGYHFVLNIPLEKLLKKQYKNLVQRYLLNVVSLKDKLLEAMTQPEISNRIKNFDAIIDQLTALEEVYGK